MTFDAWLQANGFERNALTDAQLTKLKAAWQAEAQPPEATPVAQQDRNPAQPEVRPTQTNHDQGRDLEAIVNAGKAERERRAEITDLFAEAIRDNPQQIEELEALGHLALKDRWDRTRCELAILKACRPNPGFVFSRDRPDRVTPEVVEAALCTHGGLANMDRHFDARTLEAAHKRFGSGGLSLGEFLLVAAKENGYRGDSFKSNLKEVFRYAFTPNLHAAGSTSPSLHTLASTVLSNTANKHVRVAFEAVDSAWRQISSIRSVTDFKAITTYSLTGSLNYDVLAPGGEIKHGTLGSETYTNQADTYAKMLGIDRRDLINDDLGALTRVLVRLGRGAATQLNLIFWAEFLNNSSFFASGNSNVSTGAGSALSLTGLAAADAVFRAQTDPDGHPLGLMPKILLVPNALRVTALNMINSTTTSPDSTGTANTTPGVGFPTTNAFAGTLQVVSSPYMSLSSLTGYSAAAWYILADPADLPTIEVCFLGGRETPVVETEDADFGTLGIAMRGYHDFGVNLQEYRAGVRSAGS